MPDERGSLRNGLRDAAFALGFGAFGIARAEPLDSERERVDAWLAANHHGSMSYLARNGDVRLDPELLLHGARSVICVAHVYLAPEPSENTSRIGADTAGSEGTAAPFIARYARGRDYHRVLKGKLRKLVEVIDAAEPGSRSRICVDTAPLLEKAWAERAGIGWRGKHTNLVSRALGSWTVLGEVLSTVELEPDRPHLDFCGTCRSCLEACPTDAFPRPYVMDARRCISYLTIEHRGALGEERAEALGDRLFGCDDCLAACPWNRFHEPTDEPDFQARQAIMGTDLEGWLRLSDAELDERLRGSAMRRAGLDGIRRNAAAVLGNREGDTG